MPSINIYTNKDKVKSLTKILPELQDFTAKALSCGDRTLRSNEISLRIIVPKAALQIADIEIEINAYSYAERVKKQDEICLAIKDYLQKKCIEAGTIYVWLQLSELGHSAKE